MDYRKASYKAPQPPADQATRRQEALSAQRNRRSDALASIRGIDDLGFLDLNDSASSDEDGDGDSPSHHFADPDQPQPTPRPTFQSSASPFGSSPSAPSAGPAPEASHPAQSMSKKKRAQKHERKRRCAEKRYRRFANGCMYAELLDLSPSPLLQELVDHEWIVLSPVPAGKRCLALTYPARGGSNNTLLLSRVAAKPLGRFSTVLPPNCILDCILAPSLGTSTCSCKSTTLAFQSYKQERGEDQPDVLWILDVLQWKEQSYIDCEAEFRFFWRDNKLSELSLQPLGTSLVVLPVPLTPSSPALLVPHLRTLLSSLRLPPSLPLPLSVPVPLVEADGGVVKREVVLVPDGVLMCVKSATYESGQTVLAGWVPLLPDEGGEAEMIEDSPVSPVETLLRICEGAEPDMQS